MTVQKKLLAAILASTLAMPVHTARADTPAVVVVVAVGAPAAVGGAEAALAALAVASAALIAGSAQIISAVITAEAQIKTTTKDNQSKRTAAPSTEVAADAGDSDAFLPVGPLPKTLREFILQRGGKIGLSPFGTGSDAQLVASTDFEFQGDVLSAPDNVGSFEHNETFTYDLVVSDKEATGTINIPFVLKQLNLSTKDLPGSLGHSQITISSQSGKAKMTWRARVDQGKKPKHDKVFAASGSIKASNDNLVFSKPAIIPIPVELGADKTGKVRITVSYQGSGKRT